MPGSTVVNWRRRAELAEASVTGLQDQIDNAHAIIKSKDEKFNTLLRKSISIGLKLQFLMQRVGAYLGELHHKDSNASAELRELDARVSLEVYYKQILQSVQEMIDEQES